MLRFLAGHERPTTGRGILEDPGPDGCVFSEFRHVQFPSMPAMPPGLVLGRPQTVARDIAFMEAHYLRFDDFDETRLVLRRHLLRGTFPK